MGNDAAGDAAVLASRLAEAEREISKLRVELAIANERADSFRQLAAAKDDIIVAARNQTKEWRKHAGEVLTLSSKTMLASAGGGGGGGKDGKDKKKK